MADGNIIRCECGYRLRTRTEQRQVAEVRRHAWEAHSISFSTDEALAILLRFALEVDADAPADSAASDTASGKEKR